MKRSRSLKIAIFALLMSTTNASACDIPFPRRGSSASWPEDIIAAKVKVLNVRNISELYRYAQVNLVQRLKGNLPYKFGILYDISSCGSNFVVGEIRITGLTLLPRTERTKSYHFSANSLAETWARAVFVDRTLTLKE